MSTNYENSGFGPTSPPGGDPRPVIPLAIPIGPPGPVPVVQVNYAGHATAGFWRDGNRLVAAKGAPFPPRCVKCNGEATGKPLKRSLSWHSPAIYLTLLGGVLIYVIVALIVRKSATVHVGLCARHRSRRRTVIAITWLLVLLAPVVVIVGGNADLPLLVVLGILFFLGGLIFYLVAGQTVLPAQIDDRFVWLKGVCPEFLSTLDYWPGWRR